MQAILHASQDEDEFVKEYLVTYEKVCPVNINIATIDIARMYSNSQSFCGNSTLNRACAVVNFSNCRFQPL